MASMVEVPLTRERIALIDDDDFETVSRFKWCCDRQKDMRSPIYAITWNKGKIMRMHRLILNAQPGQLVDHINGNGLDNRRSNIRICTIAENAHNIHKTRGKSIFKGVSWHDKHKIWDVTITLDCTRIYIGTYKNELEAALAYDEAARKYHGVFASLNFPGQNN
jgi:hypothetical protein